MISYIAGIVAIASAAFAADEILVFYRRKKRMEADAQRKLDFESASYHSPPRHVPDHDHEIAGCM